MKIIVCAKSQQWTQKSENSSLTRKKWNFFPELFPTLTQWHSVHHLRILPVQTRERFIASVHILPVKRMFVTSYYGMCHMSATHDTKKRFSQKCCVFFSYTFSRSLSGLVCIFCEKS